MFDISNGFKCCICGEMSYGFGNNPSPIMDEGDCCDCCNMEYVVSARLILDRLIRVDRMEPDEAFDLVQNYWQNRLACWRKHESQVG